MSIVVSSLKGHTFSLAQKRKIFSSGINQSKNLISHSVLDESYDFFCFPSYSLVFYLECELLAVMLRGSVQWQ